MGEGCGRNGLGEEGGGGRGREGCGRNRWGGLKRLREGGGCARSGGRPSKFEVTTCFNITSYSEVPAPVCTTG